MSNEKRLKAANKRVTSAERERDKFKARYEATILFVDELRKKYPDVDKELRERYAAKRGIKPDEVKLAAPTEVQP